MTTTTKVNLSKELGMSSKEIRENPKKAFKLLKKLLLDKKEFRLIFSSKLNEEDLLNLIYLFFGSETREILQRIEGFNMYENGNQEINHFNTSYIDYEKILINIGDDLFFNILYVQIAKNSDENSCSEFFNKKLFTFISKFQNKRNRGNTINDLKNYASTGVRNIAIDNYRRQNNKQEESVVEEKQIKLSNIQLTSYNERKLIEEQIENLMYVIENNKQKLCEVLGTTSINIKKIIDKLIEYYNGELTQVEFFQDLSIKVSASTASNRLKKLEKLLSELYKD